LRITDTLFGTTNQFRLSPSAIHAAGQVLPTVPGGTLAMPNIGKIRLDQAFM